MSQTSRWCLSPSVHAAAVGADLVLLDVRADAYFCLPDGAAGLTGNPRAGEITGLADELVEDLAAADLVHWDDGPPRARLDPITPEADLAILPTPSLEFAAIGAFARGLGGLTQSFARKPLSQILLHAAARRVRLGAVRGPASLAAVDQALGFRAVLPWSPIQGACLMQAALLLDVLAQSGHSADWVFGVRTWPFSAHCWVQAGAVVLNDTVERVSAYQPILVV